MDSENVESAPEGGENQDVSLVDTATEGSLIDTAKVSEVIEILRPAIQADGGDIELVEIDAGSGVVTVQLQGACISCPASTITMKAGIERIMKDRVPGVTSVVQPGDLDNELDRTGSL